MSADSYAKCPKCGAEGFEGVREYHEQGIMDAGEFFVDYHGTCMTCDFEHEFSHRNQLTPKENKT